MEEFYLKYESTLSKLNQIALKEMVDKWIVNLNEEIDILMTIKSTISMINECLIDGEFGYEFELFLSSLVAIVDQFKEYAVEIKRNIDLFPNTNPEEYMNDTLINNQVLFLKDNYNNILILIEQFFSINRSLIQLRNNINKKKNMSNNDIATLLMKINLNKSQFNQLISDSNNIKETQKRQRNKFGLLNSRGYPSIKEMNQLDDQFRELKQVKINEVNKKNKMRKRNANTITHNTTKKLNKTFELPNEVSALYHYERRELGIDLNVCKDICKEINEKLKRYCVCITDSNAIDNLKTIRTENIKIEDSVILIKSEMKDLVRGIKEINARIETFQKTNSDIVIINNTLNKKFININDQSNHKQFSSFVKWTIPQEKPSSLYCNSNKSIALLNSKSSNQEINNTIKTNNTYIKSLNTEESNQKYHTTCNGGNKTKWYLLSKD